MVTTYLADLVFVLGRKLSEVVLKNLELLLHLLTR